MSMVNRLIDQLKQRGLHVEFGNEENVLLLCGPAKEKTPEVLDAVRKFKPELLKLYAPPPGEAAAPPVAAVEPPPEVETCRVCGADVSDPETRALLADPAHCDRGGAKAATDANGVFHEAAERCPYKPGGRRAPNTEAA